MSRGSWVVGCPTLAPHPAPSTVRLSSQCEREPDTEYLPADGRAAAMTNLLIRLVVSAGAVLLAQWLFPGYIGVQGEGSAALGYALLFAVVLGIMNALVRPVLLLLTCPFTLLTLGLFIFVVNALVFWLAGALAPGIRVEGFAGALLGSLVVTLCSAIANHYLE